MRRKKRVSNTVILPRTSLVNKFDDLEIDEEDARPELQLGGTDDLKEDPKDLSKTAANLNKSPIINPRKNSLLAPFNPSTLRLESSTL